jgi:hypothetical protein
MVEEMVVNKLEPMAKVLKELGWVTVTERIYLKWESGEVIHLTDDLLEFIDLVYMNGVHFGIQRMLYETETMEDCEKEDQDLMDEMKSRYQASKTPGSNP